MKKTSAWYNCFGNMKNLLCILLVFISFAAKSQQTYSINGTVNDEKGITLPGATVFITNSRYVVATDNEGKFSFGNVRPGTYEVVVKMVGFDPGIQSVTVRNKPMNLTVTLKESITALKAVTISAAPDPDREKYMELFMKNFIGETINAQQCKLLNPGVLRFKFDKNENILHASADEFVIVKNNALGYTVKYLLTEFTYNLKNNVCTTVGAPYFEELKGTQIQQKQWGENRRLAYISSDRHFFRCLIDDKLKENGFTVYLIIKSPIIKNAAQQSAWENNLLHANLDFDRHFIKALINNILNDKGFPVYQVINDPFIKSDGFSGEKNSLVQNKLTAFKLSDTDSLFIANNTNFKTLISTPKVIGKDTLSLTGLYVISTGIKQSALFYKTGIPLKPIVKLSSWENGHSQISQIQPLTDTIVIDKSGGLTPTKAFEYSGYWAWERIADLTPLDYFGEPAPANK